MPIGIAVYNTTFERVDETLNKDVFKKTRPQDVLQS